MCPANGGKVTLDTVNIRPYPHHSASVRTARPSRSTRPRDDGRAVAYHDLGTVTAPITKNNPPQPTATRSARSTTEQRRYVVTLNGGGQRYLGAVVRGFVAAARWWRRWVTVRDFREAAELSEKLADKFIEIRALTLFRWKATGAVVISTVVGSLIADLLYGRRALWIAAGIASAALAILGRRTDGSPGRKAVLAGPRTLTWTMDPQVLVDAFRDAKLISKDETLRLVELATRQGEGWAITVDLPATRKATDVIKNREALASALAVDEVQLIVERVRGNGGHARPSVHVGSLIMTHTPRRRCGHRYWTSRGGMRGALSRLDATPATD
jgi:hypothetical protein